jgi:hypothetical protein
MHADEIPYILEIHSTATFLLVPTPQYTCLVELRASWERRIERSMPWPKPAKEIQVELISWEDNP